LQPEPPPDPDLNPPVPDAEPGGEFVLPGDDRWITLVFRGLGLVLFGLVLLIAGARIAVLTDPGRGFVIGLVEGLPVGPAGRLHVDGLKGDVFGRFSLARLQVIDRRGV